MHIYIYTNVYILRILGRGGTLRNLRGAGLPSVAHGDERLFGRAAHPRHERYWAIYHGYLFVCCHPQMFLQLARRSKPTTGFATGAPLTPTSLCAHCRVY